MSGNRLCRLGIRMLTGLMAVLVLLPAALGHDERLPPNLESALKALYRARAPKSSPEVTAKEIVALSEKVGRLGRGHMAHFAGYGKHGHAIEGIPQSWAQSLVLGLDHYRGWGKRLGRPEACADLASRVPERLGAALMTLSSLAADTSLRSVADWLANHWTAESRAVAGRLVALIHHFQRPTGQPALWCTGVMRKLLRDSDPAVVCSVLEPVVPLREVSTARVIAKLLSHEGRPDNAAQRRLSLTDEAVGAVAAVEVGALRLEESGGGAQVDPELPVAELGAWYSKFMKGAKGPIPQDWTLVLDRVVVLKRGASVEAHSQLGVARVQLDTWRSEIRGFLPRFTCELRIHFATGDVVNASAQQTALAAPSYGGHSGSDTVAGSEFSWKYRVFLAPAPAEDKANARVLVWRKKHRKADR